VKIITVKIVVIIMLKRRPKINVNQAIVHVSMLFSVNAWKKIAKHQSQTNVPKNATPMLMRKHKRTVNQMIVNVIKNIKNKLTNVFKNIAMAIIPLLNQVNVSKIVMIKLGRMLMKIVIEMIENVTKNIINKAINAQLNAKTKSL